MGERTVCLFQNSKINRTWQFRQINIYSVYAGETRLIVDYCLHQLPLDIVNFQADFTGGIKIKLDIRRRIERIRIVA